jgi:hypothetical protein
MEKTTILDILKRKPEFISLPRDSRTILMKIVMASDLDDPNNWFEFKRSDTLAAQFEISVKTLHRRVDDIVTAGLLEKRENTSKVRFTQLFLDICHINFTLTPDDNVAPETREARLNAAPANDSYTQPDNIAGPTIVSALARLSPKIQRTLMNPRIEIKDGKCVIFGDRTPVSKVNLEIPRWLHSSVRKAAYDNGLTIVDTINAILYKYFEDSEET